MIAQAGAALGAPPMPVEESDAGIMIAGRGSLFDPSHDNFSADGRGDRPDPVLARILGQPNLAPFALAMPNSAAISNNALHPAILLNLSGAALQKAQKCLSEAVYFESRSEPEDGQIAVAQVVLNRATSGFYPNDVCGVVFQNAHRYLGCQFTFACEGKANLIPTEPEPWARAQKISQAMLAGRLWLPKVGNATHYHATYVRPYWVRSMKKHDHIGLHVFYRPKAWEG
jgi:spore germination cell wall hydrolase CwlJ-like protein